jgi:putative DNA primase/helicase
VKKADFDAEVARIDAQHIRHNSDEDADDNVKHSGHLGMAIKLGQQFVGRLLYVHGIDWHRWDGKRWARDETGAARRAVHTVIRRDRTGVEALALPPEERERLRKQIARYETSPAIAGILTEASVLVQFAVGPDAVDADPWSLNCANGTLDLHTMRLWEHDPADRITKICRGAYRPDAPAPEWVKFLERILPDEALRSFVQRLAGLALLGAVREHLLPIFTGTGANGKSTLYTALLHTLGDYAHAAEPDLFMHRDGVHPTGQMDLFGRRLVIVSESDEGRRLAGATMKRLTGGDPITARYMHKDFVSFTPSHLAILVTNHLPAVRGDDPAIWRRIRVVPFDVVIPEHEQDTDLDTKLALEADGILSWAIAGWADYLKDGLHEPATVRTATDTYQHRSDDVGRFITERCTLGVLFKATTQHLYDAWRDWQETEGAPPIGRKEFGHALDRAGYPTQQAREGKRWRIGIALREPTDDE